MKPLLHWLTGTGRAAPPSPAPKPRPPARPQVDLPPLEWKPSRPPLAPEDATPSPQPPATPAFAARRSPSGQVALSEAAAALLAALPEHVRPHELPAHFPRIVNRIADLWRRPRQLDAYLEDLLIDRRGDRQGFPPQAAMELATLKEHYERHVFPKATSIWDDALG